MNNRQQLYVHVQLKSGEYVVAGYHELDQARQLGTFIYGRSYCENAEAFPLDPINLPLVYGREFHFPITRFNPSGVPGALLDCGPDEWGKRLLNRFHEPKPVSTADYLVFGSGYGVGALRFSDTPVLEKPQVPTGEHKLNELYKGAVTFDQQKKPDQKLQPLLVPSSGIGGARPKAHVLHKGRAYIAKFNRPDDRFDNALAEYCMMRLAHKAGIDSAEAELVATDSGNALLVERFDIADHEGNRRHHLLSANSLLNIQSIEQLNDIGYDRIAAVGRQISASADLARAVFVRMLFNIAIGNTDDHTRNHAFLKLENSGQYRLSPAYDLVPLPERLGSHAINIGPFGQSPSKDNIQSGGRLMGLSETMQKQCAEQVIEVVQTLESSLLEMGMTEEDVNYLKPCFARRALVKSLTKH